MGQDQGEETRTGPQRQTEDERSRQSQTCGHRPGEMEKGQGCGQDEALIGVRLALYRKEADLFLSARPSPTGGPPPADSSGR